MAGRRIEFVLLWIITGLLCGCAGLFRSRTPLPIIPPDVLVQRVQDHASQLQTFEGRAELTVVSPMGSFRGSMQIFARIPDSLWFKVEGPLGIDVMTARFVGDRVLLYSPLENVVYDGSVQRMRERNVLPLDMGSSDLVLGIVGLLVPEEGVPDSAALCSDNHIYRLCLGNEDQIWVEPKGPVVSRWEIKGIDGDELWVWEGKDFQKRSGVRLPRMVRLTEYNPKQRVTLFFEVMKTNRRLKNGWWRVHIPEGVETIEL